MIRTRYNTWCWMPTVCHWRRTWYDPSSKVLKSDVVIRIRWGYWSWM